MTFLVKLIRLQTDSQNQNTFIVVSIDFALRLHSGHHVPDVGDVALSCPLPNNIFLVKERTQHHRPLLPAGLQSAGGTGARREPRSPRATGAHGRHGAPREGWPGREGRTEGAKGRSRYLAIRNAHPNLRQVKRYTSRCLFVEFLRITSTTKTCLGRLLQRLPGLCRHQL